MIRFLSTPVRNLLSAFTLMLTLLASYRSAPAQSGDAPGVWTPDNGDGTFRNPVIYADYSDPDVIRAGKYFYLVSSSFANTPGLPILRSEDLVNWKIVGHAIDELPGKSYDVPRHGGGVWAPSIRFHDREFYVYYGDPDLGIFMVRSKNPLGQWSAPVRVMAARGRIDPCPLWDDDGNAYLVHAWAKSRAGFNSVLTVCRMNKEGTRVVDSGRVVFDGHGTQPTIEGPKLYKRNGYYYIFAPAGGVAHGWQTVLRSRSVYGPYEARIVLAQGHTGINGPHQGAWVETRSHESWFVHFQEHLPYGRVVWLEPMRWEDDWPIIGEVKGNEKAGEPVLNYRKPDADGQTAIEVPQTSDEFDEARLGPQWQWEANHRPGWISLNRRKGWLRMYSSDCPGPDGNLWSVPSLLMQKFPAPEFAATVKVELHQGSNGERAGLLVFGTDYSYIAVETLPHGYAVIRGTCLNADEGSRETVADMSGIGTGSVFLRVAVADGGRCSFFYSEDGENFRALGGDFVARGGVWVGARVGLFTDERGGNSPGYADFDWVRFTRPEGGRE